MSETTPTARPTFPPPPPDRPETDAERRDRQLAYFRRAGDLNMYAAEVAADRIRVAHEAGPDANTAAPTLDLARATRCLTLAVANENRVARAEGAEIHARAEGAETRPRAPADDPRRPELRAYLHDVVNRSEPNPAARAKLRRDVDDRVEEALLADPDAEQVLGETVCDIAEQLGLHVDVRKFPDEFLGMPPASERRPAWESPEFHDPARWACLPPMLGPPLPSPPTPGPPLPSPSLASPPLPSDRRTPTIPDG